MMEEEAVGSPVEGSGGPTDVAADIDMDLQHTENEEDEENDDDESGTTDSDDDEDDVDEVPEQKFQVRQKVYARDDKASGVLYESVVRRAMWGLREKKINVLLVNPDDPNALKLEDEDEEEWCWHYFVHYQGWNVKWDRWVEEGSLYVANEASRELAALLKKELDKIVKLQRKGGGGNDINVIRRLMAQLEAEFREEERREELRKKGLLPPKADDDNAGSDGNDEGDDNKDGDAADGDTLNNKKGDGADAVAGGGEDPKEPATSSGVTPKPKKKTYPKALLEKEKKLRKKHLEGKLWRKASHAQKIVLPFTLKKVMVEEWELVTLCGMVPRLPSGVPIREALNRFLQNKLQQLGIAFDGAGDGHRSAAENCGGGNRSSEEEKKDGDPADVSAELEAMENAELEAMTEDDETAKKRREWEEMVNGVAQLFDEALPVHLLYEQERMHHRVIMRSEILEGKLPSEIYGCEYLLRLMVQFPTLLLESGLPESDMRTILSKMNELLRFLQKHQSELFNATYRKPEGKELKKRIPRKMKKEKAAESGVEGMGETGSPQSGDNYAKKRNFADVSSSVDAASATKKAQA